MDIRLETVLHLAQDRLVPLCGSLGWFLSFSESLGPYLQKESRYGGLCFSFSSRRVGPCGTIPERLYRGINSICVVQGQGHNSFSLIWAIGHAVLWTGRLGTFLHLGERFVSASLKHPCFPVPGEKAWQQRSGHPLLPTPLHGSNTSVGTLMSLQPPSPQS